MTAGEGGRRPLFELLDRGDVERIHAGALEVLETAGVFVESEEAIEVFAAGGCRVDRGTRIVQIPPGVVEEALRAAPSRPVAHGRIRARDVILDESAITFTNFGEGVFVTDPFTGERRPSTKADVGLATLAVDGIDEIAVCERPLVPHDVPQAVAALHNADAILRNTTKHAYLGAQSGFLAERMVELQAAILGSAEAVRERPLLTFTVCPVSPLKLVTDCCEVIMVGARSGVGLNIVSMAMAGGSAPVTLAGTLVTHDAEVLAGVTLAQLTAPGTCVVYGSASTGIDLRFGTATAGSPELALIGAAVAQLARRHGLPSFVAGGLGDGKVSDAQAGHEKTLTALLVALSGANVIFGMGMMESGLTFDFAQLMLDAEFVRMIGHCLGGVRVDDEALAISDICAVGPFGDFLSLDSTYRHMREMSRPQLLDRRVREDWLQAGATDAYARAAAQACCLLNEHRPEALPADVEAEMTRIVAAAEVAAPG
jgi:trimethylamine---corrinoid protein Co-methyltransferase